MNNLKPVENLKNVHPPPRKAPLNRGWMLKSNIGGCQYCLNAAHILPNTVFRGGMSENRLYEKLDLLAKRTEGVFLSSALVSSKDESSSWVKFQQKYPEMFTVIFSDRAKIFQGTSSFFRFFYVDKIPKVFKTKEEVITEILHTSFVLDIGRDSTRVASKVYLKSDIYSLDTFEEASVGSRMITLDERKRAFVRPTTAYIPKNLQSKWSRLCLQKYYLESQKEDRFEVTPEFAKDFITGKV